MEEVIGVEFDLNVMEPIEAVGRLRSYLHIASAAWRKAAAFLDGEGNILFDMSHQSEHPLTVYITNLDLNKQDHLFVAQTISSAATTAHRYNVTYVVSFTNDGAVAESKWLDSLVNTAIIEHQHLVLVDMEMLRFIS